MNSLNNMEIIEYFSCENKEHWLTQIEKSDWGAAQYLAYLLKDNKLSSLVGEGASHAVFAES